MDFYEVLERRRTYRDFSDRKVSDEVLKRVICSAFKAPTNDHLRQLEFVVVRSRENISKVVAPLAKNMAAFKELVFEVDESGRRTAQTTENVDGERAAYYPFLPSADTSTVEARGTEFAQLLCLGLVRVGEHVACCYQRRAWGCIPYSRGRRG